MRALVNVVEAGSLSRAAERLGVSPAMVTKYLNNLEGHLDTRLLSRSTRRLSLTKAGHAYYERCVHLLEAFDELESSVSTLAQAPQGTLRVSCAPDFGAAELGEAVLDFMERYPRVGIDLLMVNRFVDLVEEGIDVAVRISDRPLNTSALVARRRATSRLPVCAAPDYLRRHGHPASPEELNGHNCLIYSATPLARAWPFEREGRVQSVRVQGRLRADSNEQLKAAAMRGEGLILQPTYNIWPQLQSGQLVRVLDDYRVGELTIQAVYPHRRYLSAKVRVFIDFLVSRFAEAADDDLWLRRIRPATGGDKS